MCECIRKYLSLSIFCLVFTKNCRALFLKVCFVVKVYILDAFIFRMWPVQPFLHYCDCVKNCDFCTLFIQYPVSLLWALAPARARVCFHTPSTSTVSTVKAFSEHPSQQHVQSCRALHEAPHYIRNQPSHSASHCVQLTKLLTTMGQVHLSSKHPYEVLKTAARPPLLSRPLTTSPVLLSIPEPNPGPVGWPVSSWRQVSTLKMRKGVLNRKLFFLWLRV